MDSAMEGREGRAEMFSSVHFKAVANDLGFFGASLLRQSCCGSFQDHNAK